MQTKYSCCTHNGWCAKAQDADEIVPCIHSDWRDRAQDADNNPFHNLTDHKRSYNLLWLADYNTLHARIPADSKPSSQLFLRARCQSSRGLWPEVLHDLAASASAGELSFSVLAFATSKQRSRLRFLRRQLRRFPADEGDMAFCPASI